MPNLLDQFQDLGALNKKGSDPIAELGFSPVSDNADPASSVGFEPVKNYPETLARDDKFNEISYGADAIKKGNPSELDLAFSVFKHKYENPEPFSVKKTTDSLGHVFTGLLDSAKGVIKLSRNTTGLAGNYAHDIYGAGKALFTGDASTLLDPTVQDEEQQQASEIQSAAGNAAQSLLLDFPNSVLDNAHGLKNWVTGGKLSDDSLRDKFNTLVKLKGMHDDISEKVFDSSISPSERASKTVPDIPNSTPEQKQQTEEARAKVQQSIEEGVNQQSGAMQFAMLPNSLIDNPMTRGAATGLLWAGGAATKAAADVIGKHYGYGVGYGIFSHSPERMVEAVAAGAAAKHVLPAVAKLATDAGDALWNGAPIQGGFARQTIGKAFQGMAQGTVLGTAFALGAQSPEEAIGDIAGGAMVAPIFLLDPHLEATSRGGEIRGRNAQAEVEAAQAEKASGLLTRGQQIQRPDQASHEAGMELLDPRERDRINVMQGFLSGRTNQDGSQITVNVLPQDQFANLGGGRERGFVGKDGNIYLNAGMADQPGGIERTSRHEFGHVADRLSEILGDDFKGSLSRSIASKLYDSDGDPIPAFSKFIKKYEKDLGKKVDQGQREREFIAETVSKILESKPIEDFTEAPGLMERIRDGASDAMKALGLAPKAKDGIFNWEEIPAITRNMKDILRGIGKGVEESPQEAQKPAQATQPSSVTPEAPPAPASAPLEPVAQPVGSRDDVESALVRLGYKKGDAKRLAASAQGATTEEMLTNALSGRTAEKGGAPNEVQKEEGTQGQGRVLTPTQEPPAGPLSDMEAPAEAPLPSLSEINVNEPQKVSTIPKVAAQAGGLSTMEAGLPKEGQGKAPGKVSSSDLVAAADLAEAQVRANRTSRHKEHTLQPAINKARLEAMATEHANQIGTDNDLVTMRTNKFGKTGIYGQRIDLSDPFHQELLKRAGLNDPQDLKKLSSIQSKIATGKPIGMEYLSAPESPGAKAAYSEALKSPQQTKALREQAQAEHTAGARAEDGAPIRRVAKSYIPTGFTFNGPSGTIEVNGFSPDKVLSNAGKLLPWLKTKGLEPYSGVNDPNIIRDLNIVSKNHSPEIGWRGDGSEPVKETELTTNLKPADQPAGTIPRDRFDALNAMLGDTSAGKINEAGKAKRATVENTEKNILAKENSPFYDPQTGETNKVRDLMEKEGDFKFSEAGGEEHTGKHVLESAWETLRPELIENIGDPNIRNEHTIRPSEFTGNIRELRGRPRSDFTAGGFMPSKKPIDIESEIFQSNADEERTRMLDLRQKAREINKLSVDEATDRQLEDAANWTEEANTIEERLNNIEKPSSIRSKSDFSDFMPSDMEEGKEFKPSIRPNGSLMLSADEMVANNPEMKEAKAKGASLEETQAISAKLHAGARAARDAALEQVIASPVTPENQRVIMSAGGPGSGKSTGLQDVSKTAVIYDTNLRDAEKAQSQINAIVDSGRNVQVRYVHRPFEDAVRGNLDRAASEGRLATAADIAEGHYAARNAIEKLIKNNQDNPAVDIDLRFNKQNSAPTRMTPEELIALPKPSVAELKKTAYVTADDHETQSNQEAVRLFRGMEGGSATDGGSGLRENGGEAASKETIDYRTGRPTLITSGRISAADSKRISEKTSSVARDYAKAIHDAIESGSDQSFEQAARLVPDTRIQDIGLEIDPDYKLPEPVENSDLKRLGRGGESITFGNGEIAYKLFYPQGGIGDGIGISARIHQTNDGKWRSSFEAGTISSLLEKLAVIGKVGGVPSEIVGMADNGSLIVKQPQFPKDKTVNFNLISGEGKPVKEFNETHTRGQMERMVNWPDKQDYAFEQRAHVAVVDGVPYILEDLNGGNYTIDNPGRFRIADAVVGRIPKEMLDEVPELAAQVKRLTESEKTDRANIDFMPSVSDKIDGLNQKIDEEWYKKDRNNAYIKQLEYQRAKLREQGSPAPSQKGVYSPTDEDKVGGGKKVDVPKGQIQFSHWSRFGGLDTLDPSYHGTGRLGAERKRKAEYPDRYVDRTYIGTGKYIKESGIGNNRYDGTIDKKLLYDADSDPLDIDSLAVKYSDGTKNGIATEYERLIKEHGYLGYRSDQHDVAAIFHKIPAGGEVTSKEFSESAPGYERRAPEMVRALHEYVPNFDSIEDGYFDQKPAGRAQVDRQRNIAQEYDALKTDNLSDPRVQRSYDALAEKVGEQYDRILKGVDVEPWNGKGEPYANSAEMQKDIQNGHLYFFKTTPEAFGSSKELFQDHPMLQDSGKRTKDGYKLLNNDLLRTVHDAIAHGAFGLQFGPAGEEAAWRAHMATINDPWARWALTTETRGQNSWVNYNEGLLNKSGEPLKKGEKGYIAPQDRSFAEQKADLLPGNRMLTGDKTVDAVVKDNPEFVKVAGIDTGTSTREKIDTGNAVITVHRHPETGQFTKPPSNLSDFMPSEKEAKSNSFRSKDYLESMTILDDDRKKKSKKDLSTVGD